jgi:glycine oxidase
VDTRSVDVAIVGGGIVGLATAWRLRRDGRSVAVIDPTPATAATHAAAGMLAPVSEVTYGETALLRLAMESLERYPAFVAAVEAEIGRPVGLRREGTLIVATDAGDRAMLVDLHAFQTSLGLSATMLTSRECRAVEATLAPEVRGGLLVDSDHSVDNRRLAAALIDLLDAAGALVRDRVTAVIIDGNRATGVDLAAGTTLAASAVVIAAGPWSPTIDGVPDAVRPPVRPVKGEILRLRSTGSIPLPTHSIRGLVNGHEIYLVPRADGELVVGATVEDMGFDTAVRAGAVRELLRDARAVMPAIDEYELVESFAALRPGSPDNAPIIGRSEIDGLLVASGHYRNGILLAPITADLIAAIIEGSVSDSDQELLDVASPQRFAPVGTQP